MPAQDVDGGVQGHCHEKFAGSGQAIYTAYLDCQSQNFRWHAIRAHSLPLEMLLQQDSDLLPKPNALHVRTTLPLADVKRGLLHLLRALVTGHRETRE